MQNKVIDKVWLVGLIGLIGSIVARMFNFPLPMGYEELIYNAGVAVFSLVTAFKNMTKPEREHPFDGGGKGEQSNSPLGDHGPMA